MGSDPQVPAEVLDEAILAAARAWCQTRFDYPDDDYEGAERHLERDAICATEDPAFQSALAFAAPILYAAGRDQLIEAGAVSPPDLSPGEKRLLLRIALGTFGFRTECRFRHRQTGETLPRLDLRIHELAEWAAEARLVIETEWRPSHRQVPADG